MLPASRPAPRPLALLGLVVMLVLGVLLSGPSPARADGPDEPVGLVIVTSGLGWEDVSPEATPTLQCLADRSGLGAMNTTSTTVVSTQRQGVETLRTGYRGLAEEAPRTSGIPTPPTDQWEQLPVDVTTLNLGGSGAEASGADGTDVAEALGAGDLVEVIAPSLPENGDPARADALTALDGTVAAVLEELGGCEAAGLPRTLLVSVAATDPEDPAEVERTGAVASRTVGLQVVMDTAFPGQTLTSGATKQTGVVVLTDVLPTILGSHDASADGLIPGQPLRGVDHDDPQQLALDRSLAAAEVDAATVPALGSWLALGVIGLVMILVPPLARRPRVRAIGRALAAVAPLALTGVVWGGCLLLSAIVLGGPWRRHPFGPVGVSAALIAVLMLGESATGSRFQLSSPLGSQPISGGRFYGLSNHLFGMVLAAAMMALLCLFTVLATARARTLWTLVVGGLVAAVCVAPSMGADFGSMLATVPAFGLLALLVSGIRLRLWHVLALGAGGGAAVLGVSFVDWLRPAEDRTHLGRFIDELLSGELLTVIIRKLAQNVAMTTGYPALLVVMILALLASVAVLMPRILRWRSLAALDQQHPTAYAVRLCLVVGTWVGYLVNDTGPVLVASIFGIWLALLPAVLPRREDV